MSSNYTTFRVRGIPAGSSKKDVEAMVKEALASEDSGLFRLKSLANDRPRSREMVATINFERIPAQLANCISGAEWGSELSDDIALLFDTHFHGCTTLSCPPEDSWKFDVFAISGLNGHAFGSFKKKNNSYMWLRDALRGDFPDSRIIIYGYDTVLQGSKSFQNILDIGHKFRNALAEARPTKEKKPLVLIGHSLGEIVVKQAINDMRLSELDQDRENFATICGIVFFGVPNQGMDIHSLIPMVGNQPNRGLLQNLEHNSPVLRIQAKEFSAALAKLRCNVLNFYETQESPTARQDESGKWSMTGKSAVLVNTFSATHGRPDDAKNHQVYPIDRSHSDLVKFSSHHDEAYRTLVAYLNGIHYSETGSQTTMSEDQAGCLQSLGFREQYQRMDALEPAEGTCDWLITHEFFVRWLANSKGFLWIRGMPGSGKSMAMKHMVKHVKSLASTDAVVASFFFHAQGVDLQKSLLGLYRALLHQLYPHFLHVFPDLTARYKDYTEKFGHGKQDWSWMNGEIRRYFLEGIPNACRNKPIVLFVDAVDEAGIWAAKEIFRDFQQLLASLGDPACQLRVCVSCRHYPEIILESGETIVMESLNHEDMHRVVSARIDHLRIFNESEKHQIKADVLGKSGGIFQWISLVVDNIVHERVQGNSFEAALETMERVPTDLNSLYKALLEAGEQQCSLLEQKQRRALFHWLLFATRRLSPRELQHALALSQDTKHRSIRDYKNSTGFIVAENWEIRIRTLSKGLVQIRGSSDSCQVEFIHQSVVEFLTSGGGLRLLSNSSDVEPIRLAHFDISRSCLKYLLMDEINEFLRTRRVELMGWITERASTKVKQGFPLISYAWKHWIFHAVSAKSLVEKATKHNDDDILEAFQWPNDQVVTHAWYPLREILGCPLESWRVAFCRDLPLMVHDRSYNDGCRNIFDGNDEGIAKWPIPTSRLMHLFALCGLLDGSVHERMIPEIASLDSLTAKAPSPLVYAIAGQQKQVIRRLIAAGARCRDQGLEHSKSPIHLASTSGDVEIIFLLINNGSDSTSPDSKGYTPLHVTAAYGHLAATNFLLNSGAKLNSKAHDGSTPLHLATRFGHVEVSERLLEFGADPNMKNSEGENALLKAVCEGKVEITKLLLRCGAKERADMLLEAVGTGNLEIVRLLLQHGANVNVRNKDGETALFTAVKNEEKDIAKLLIAFGADINAVDAYLQVPLHLADTVGFAELLLQHGANPNIKNKFGCTPLIKAMESLNDQIGRLLLEAGADPNMKDDRGRTALMAASEAPPNRYWNWMAGGKVDAIKLLLQFGADPTARSLDGTTAHSDPKDERIDKLLGDAGSPLHRGVGSKRMEAFVSSHKSWARMKRHKFRQEMIKIGLITGIP